MDAHLRHHAGRGRAAVRGMVVDVRALQWFFRVRAKGTLRYRSVAKALSSGGKTERE